MTFLVSKLFSIIFIIINNLRKNLTKKFITYNLSYITLQLVDTSSGIKDYINLNKFNDYNKHILKDDFWYNDLKNIDKIITTKPVNYNKNFDNLAYYIVDRNFFKNQYC